MKAIAAFIGAFLGRLIAPRNAEPFPSFRDQSDAARITRLRLAHQYFGVYGQVARQLALAKQGRNTVLHVAQGRSSSPRIHAALLQELARIEQRITTPNSDDLLPRLCAARIRTKKSARRIGIEAGIGRWSIQRVFRGVYAPGISVRARLESWLSLNGGAA